MVLTASNAHCRVSFGIRLRPQAESVARMGAEPGAVLCLARSQITMKFYDVYVLRNKLKNFIYVGYSENLKERIQYHNGGYVKSTKFYIPLELIHYKAYRNITDAKRREVCALLRPQTIT